MPIVNHLDLAQKAFKETNLPPTPRYVSDIIPYLNKLLSLIPKEEKAGYVKAPMGGENSMFLLDGRHVRVGRIMYSDGYMYKIMGDVPNGGPQWVTEETGDNPHLYLPYNGPYVTDVPSTNNDNEDDDDENLTELKRRVDDLETQISNMQERIEVHRQRMEAINKRFSDESDNRKELPEYIGRNWAGTVISKPRT